MKCDNCGIEFEGRADAKFCSPNCKLKAFRRKSIETDNVTFSKPIETDNFEYKTTTYDLNIAQKGRQVTTVVKTAKYWYDVPIAAKPVVKKDWPACPDYMNGRQYFLWWKNNFAVGEGESPFNGPVLHNPYPERAGPIEYVRAAEGSRRLGS
jgi:hypothetical protein